MIFSCSLFQGGGIAGHVALTGQAINVVDAYAHPLFDAQWDVMTGYKTEALVAIPIRNRAGDILGVLEIMNKIGGGSFSNWDVNVAKQFAFSTGKL